MANSGKLTKEPTGKPQGKKPKRGPGTPVEVLSSKLRYEGPLFQVFTDQVRENGHESRRDVIRHNGSVVILAIEDSGNPDPMVVVERQYRHASGKRLLEIPAGTLNPAEDPLRGAKRELLEETGLRAKHWRKLVRFFASPGFLDEWMQVFIAEGLTSGKASPDEDEQIEMRMIPFSQLLLMVESGAIEDGKTIVAALLFDRLRRSSGMHSKK